MNSDKASTFKTNFFMWRLAAWSGVGYPLGLGVCWFFLARWVPPPPEFLTAQQITQVFLDNNIGLRIAMVGILLFAPFFLSWSCVIGCLMRRIEGPNGVLYRIEMFAGVCTVIVTQVAGSAWLTASFRTAQRLPEIIQMLNDFAWTIFNVTFMIAVLQWVAWGLAILIDKRAEPLFPKWFAWFTFADAATFFPFILMLFDQTGPFSWTGLLTFWTAFIVFFLWLCFAIYYVFAAIRKVKLEEAQDSGHNSQA